MDDATLNSVIESIVPQVEGVHEWLFGFYCSSCNIIPGFLLCFPTFWPALWHFAIVPSLDGEHSCLLLQLRLPRPGLIYCRHLFIRVPRSLCFSPSSSQCIANYHTIRGFNMPTVLSFNPKKSALVIALVLVPLAILCCILAVALACSEYWSSRAPESRFSCLHRFSRRRGSKERQRSHSDPNSSSTAEIPEVSASPSEYCSPVTAREEV